MPFQPGQNYNVTVLRASLTESAQGSPGITLTLENDDEETIQHVIWMTTRALEGALRTLAIFGITQKQLKSPQWTENVSSFLAGQRCNVSIVEEEYPPGSGKKKIKVQYVNVEREASAYTPAERIAIMMGAQIAPKEEAQKSPDAKRVEQGERRLQNAGPASSGIRDDDEPPF